MPLKRCPVLECGRWSNRWGKKSFPLPSADLFNLQLDPDLAIPSNDRVCRACWDRHTGHTKSLDGRVLAVKPSPSAPSPLSSSFSSLTSTALDPILSSPSSPFFLPPLSAPLTSTALSYVPSSYPTASPGPLLSALSNINTANSVPPLLLTSSSSAVSSSIPIYQLQPGPHLPSTTALSQLSALSNTSHTAPSLVFPNFVPPIISPSFTDILQHHHHAVSNVAHGVPSSPQSSPSSSSASASASISGNQAASVPQLSSVAAHHQSRALSGIATTVTSLPQSPHRRLSTPLKRKRDVVAAVDAADSMETNGSRHPYCPPLRQCYLRSRCQAQETTCGHSLPVDSRVEAGDRSHSRRRERTLGGGSWSCAIADVV